ncbi:hypothetical protein JG688_00005543 [Phytophthora aleatoria]|uniref:Calponin-homology (CH) domain-containing protein n=1 Tax=Phytophthora aleatoria TaxID=2496075 RepID=A0A8J5IZM7_9STRA|nr:hypothetical protein JG688_00005543 [Phytophthora aleatoria]
MAELLLRWLNHELELSTHVTDVESDFASGYLLGEILHRLNHQHNFADFMRSSSVDAKVLNFCLLEPTLRNLNVEFDANVAVAIMNEKKDAAANLLYQIKMASARVGRAPGVSTKSLERTGILPLHNRPVKLAKPVYDSEKHKLFEYSIRRHVRSMASLQQEKDQIADETKKRGVYLARMAEQREILEATKAERLHRAYIHSSFIKEALEETESPAWRLALQKKSAREQRRTAFFQQLMKNREDAEENLTFSLRRKVRNDLDGFDTPGGSKAVVAGSKVSSRKSVGYGLRSLTTALNASSEKNKYSTLNLAGSSMNERELYHANVLEMESASGVIKQQRMQRERRKEILSRRRKRFVQECVCTHSRIGTARVASILEDVVLRDTNSEKDIQSEMDRILVYKEVALENRSMRNQEYVNQQEVDSMTAINRDTCCYHNLLLQFEDDSEMQGIQRNDVQVSIEAADRFLSEQISSAIMKEMVDFVLFIAGKREETLHSRDPAVFLTTETWNEYKITFVNGCNLEIKSPWPASGEPNAGMTVDEVHEAVASVVNRLLSKKQDEAELKQLQQAAGELVLMSTEEERQRRLDTFESELDEAKVAVIKIEASMAEAEEAKAKKEEMAELRQKLEETQRHLDGVMGAVKRWMEQELSSRPVPSSKYSGELVPTTAQALAALWDEMETEYISTMKTSFAQLREQRHRVTDRAQLMTSEFCEFVRRPDRKQDIVNEFQHQFNEVVDEMRFDDLTKLELHARADTLHDELGSLIDTKVAENDEELSSLVGDGWTEDTCQQVAAVYQMALQAECDRFRASIQILVNGHYAASSDCSQLSSIVEIWQSHQSRLEQACRVYRDPANETPVESVPTPVVAGKAAPKGKAKAPAPAVVAPTNVAATSEDALAESLTVTELLAEYTHVLQRCGSWIEAIAPIANDATQKVAEFGEDANQQVDRDFCKVNLLNGIKYEHDLMERRRIGEFENKWLWLQ